MSPYRGAVAITPPQRRFAWLARLVPPSFTWKAQQWRWYRRALGGSWVRHCAWFISGCPEAWGRPGDHTDSAIILEREEWS